MLEKNLTAILNIYINEISYSLVLREIAEELKIPIFEYDSKLNSDFFSNVLVKISPNESVFVQALIDLISYIEWSEFIIVYDDLTGNF